MYIIYICISYIHIYVYHICIYMYITYVYIYVLPPLLTLPGKMKTTKPLKLGGREGLCMNIHPPPTLLTLSDKTSIPAPQVGRQRQP